MPEPVRILLSEAASTALLAAGECFVLACKASTPDAGRVAIHLRPIDKSTAEGISGVLLGTHKVSRITPKKPPEDQKYVPYPSPPLEPL